MPKLGALTAARSWITVEFGAESLRVAYRPAAVTPRLQKAVAAAQRESDIDAAVLDPFCRLIDAWDLTDDEGALVEITPNALSDVPAAVLLAILAAITEDMAPNPRRADVSSNGSSPDGSAAALTGTSS